MRATLTRRAVSRHAGGGAIEPLVGGAAHLVGRAELRAEFFRLIGERALAEEELRTARELAGPR